MPFLTSGGDIPVATLISRALAAIVAIGYFVAAVMGGGAEDVIMMALYLLLPLACIWFSEEMGSFTGVMSGSLVTRQSPGCMVAAGGWLLLILPVIIGIFYYLQELAEQRH
jgi:hypothetical protein